MIWTGLTVNRQGAFLRGGQLSMYSVVPKMMRYALLLLHGDQPFLFYGIRCLINTHVFRAYSWYAIHLLATFILGFMFSKVFCFRRTSLSAETCVRLKPGVFG
jgi:hypothetical protein